jgi:dipeptidase E
MSILFAAGGGSEEDSKLLDQQFINKAGYQKRMIYIPNATKEKNYESYFNWVKSVFAAFNFTNIDMWTDLSNKEFNDLLGYSSIFIGGGNTFKLLYEIRRTGFDKLLSKYIDHGGIVYGGSAGAIILGKNILTCSHLDPNNVNLETFEGLNKFSGYAIWCHYESNNDEMIYKFVQEYKTNVIAIPEKSGVALIDDEIKVFGTENCYIFNDFNKTMIM